jgi:bacterioferritin-associated ferredoxin
MTDHAPIEPRRRIRIDGCRCKGRSFAELLAEADAGDLDLDLLTLATGAGVDCGTCYPWLRRVLTERRTCFDPQPEELDDGERLLAHFGGGGCGAS